MEYTKEDAQRKYHGVTFEGGADIGADAYIRERAYIGGGAVIREGAYIGARAYIREGADIRGGAYIREGAVIREGAYIGTVLSKYVGNISPGKEGILIRIGCETHSIAQWESHGETLAKKHNEAEWWQRTGKAMLVFLINEAENYSQGGKR